MTLYPWLGGCVLSAVLLACSPTAHHQGTEAPKADSESAAPAADNPDPPQVETAAPLKTNPEARAEHEPATSGVMPDTPADPSRSLPEVNVRNVGLHIGGQSNDPASKAPFQRAIETKFEDFLGCYRKVEQPEKGGVFGVDLFIKRPGGPAEVRQPRTGMKGGEFRDCMVSVFETIQFERPARGPTVISYSLKFEVSEPNRAAH